MNEIRPAAVAGLFYPASAEALERAVLDHLAAAGAGKMAGGSPKGVIAPHAGYVYSGPTAGIAFRQFDSAASTIQRIILIGPSHRVGFQGLALPAEEGFSTPLGLIAVDRELRAAALELPQVSVHSEAHAKEHSLEVELPFLQVLFRQFTILPLLVGFAEPGEVAEVIDRLWGDDATRFVVSSDLSHYLSYDEAREVDRRTADRILQLTGPLSPEEACGALAINGLLEVARDSMLNPFLLDLCNSGDTAGDRQQVVGYGAFSFSS